MAEKSSPPAAIAGRMENSPLPELLTYAFNQSFSGTLVLESDEHGKSAISFSQGEVAHAFAAGQEETFANQALSAAGLPLDFLAAARQSASGTPLDVFTLVEGQRLLPPDRVEFARERFVESQALSLTRLPGHTVYGFFEGLDYLSASPGPLEPLEPLLLIFQAILLEPAVQRCRRLLDPFKRDRMSLSPSARLHEAHFDGSERAVISRLNGAPHSFEDLRLLNLTTEDRLVALIYTLRATRQVAATDTRDSRVPRTVSSQALKAVSPSERTSEADASQRTRRLSEAEAKRLWDERTMEAKALEAWASAEGDHRKLRRALAVVDQAAKTFPRNAQIRYYRGCLHKQANDVDQAMNEFRRVLDLDPENLEALRELEVLNRRAREGAKKGMFGLLRKKR